MAWVDLGLVHGLGGLSVHYIGGTILTRILYKTQVGCMQGQVYTKVMHTACIRACFLHPVQALAWIICTLLNQFPTILG